MTTPSGVQMVPLGQIGHLTAGEALSSTDYRFVKSSTSEDHKALACSTGEEAIGVRINSPADDLPVDIVILGTAKLTIGSGGCTAGDKLKSDGNAAGVTASTTADYYCAKALQDASEDDVIEVLLVNGFITT